MKTTFNQEYFDALKQVKEAYKRHWNGRERQDPYKFGPWFENLTTIERNVWNDIRYLGLPFYPQFPVNRYYIDFANPFKKIAIEVDGKIHQEAEVAAKDERRDEYLKSKGWAIYRIPGWKTYKGRHNYLVDQVDNYGEVVPQYYTNTAQAILEEIKERYFCYNED
jgi:very-short-patch-repair endonuclease